ncbi:putative ACR [Candidatus Bilamarchaeum dharawalense]|uniref:Putative ACR n=1 Tax=Candidatus Bilamarchaeum dharawalense TaxID=2885759 RepID=A0A5E4LK84_9ARCH|nr:putative ACR [Candidatus Bilamarchaeum dharawalense]
MKTQEIFLYFLIIVLIVLIVYFITAKGDKRRITIINSDGKSVDIEAEMANDSATKAKGLMGRTSLGQNEGMLFTFPKAGKYGFWMFNTSIALDAIHFDENGTVVDIIAMEPCGLTNCSQYYPKTDSKYVLEVNVGFAKKNKIFIGKSKLKELP